MTTISRGVGLAAIAAIAFGVTTPLVAWAGAWVGPFATAALLYAGAAGSSVLLRVARGSGGKLVRGDVPRLVGVAIAGAAIAPALLAWGLQRTGATSGALLLNLEAVFTVALARLVFREPVGGRVGVALAAVSAGGAALVLGAATTGDWRVPGVLAIAGATLAWSIDNTLTRPLAERDPLAVVGAKGGIGAALSLAAAAIAGEHAPPLRPALVLLACGATGYGLSLRLYLTAQRRIGAARTGSVFALAPFVGAAVAIAFGDRALDWLTGLAAALFGLGVYLHVSEHHEHEHGHEAVEHDHPHRHDDGHHDHAHDPSVAGEHSHAHRHGALVHRHEHAPDLHHDHH
ncbi:MAG TPA: EamA family transporter [Kofleriaceae bacterium]|nr:EamA family transporter [Kofleriaceae bacterium]